MLIILSHIEKRYLADCLLQCIDYMYKNKWINDDFYTTIEF